MSKIGVGNFQKTTGYVVLDQGTKKWLRPKLYVTQLRFLEGMAAVPAAEIARTASCAARR